MKKYKSTMLLCKNKKTSDIFIIFSYQKCQEILTKIHLKLENNVQAILAILVDQVIAK